MAAKAQRYLAAGVRLVWLIWPKYQQVDVWRPGANQAVQTLNLGESLDGLDVLPGFTYPLARLFA
jgi:Uma2 family endonuclease